MPPAKIPTLIVSNDARTPLSVLEVPVVDSPQSLPVVNYAFAIAKAVEWMGDRYLLAIPANATLRRQQAACARVITHRRTNRDHRCQGLHDDINFNG
jgi:hypothetical protein